MIPVLESSRGVFARIGGNPTLTSLDGEVRAPLATILHASWSDADRAKFGIFLATPFNAPAGKVTVGRPHYERNGDAVQ
jgi:hypothetical protein